MSNQSNQTPPPAPRSGVGNAAIVFNFITILICSATLLITLRIHQKVTPDREVPYWLKDQNQHRDPSSLPSINQPADRNSPGGQAAPVAPVAPTGPGKPGSPNNNIPADPTGTSWRSPIPGPGENITVPISQHGQVVAATSQYQAAAPQPKAGEIVAWHQASKHFGQTITVEGKIVQMKELKDFCFLNFTDEPRGGDKFYFIIYKKDFGAIDGKLESLYLNKTLRVTGQVGEHSGRIQMKITKKDQVEVVK